MKATSGNIDHDTELRYRALCSASQLAGATSDVDTLVSIAGKIFQFLKNGSTEFTLKTSLPAAAWRKLFDGRNPLMDLPTRKQVRKRTRAKAQRVR